MRQGSRWCIAMHIHTQWHGNCSNLYHCHHVIMIWAASWQNQQNDCAHSENSDQLGHPPRLIRAFAVRSLGSYRPKLSSCGQRRFWSDWADPWAHMPFCWFCNEAAQFLLLFALPVISFKATKWILFQNYIKGRDARVFVAQDCKKCLKQYSIKFVGRSQMNVTEEEKEHGPTGTRTQDLSHTVRALWPLSYRATRPACDNFPLLKQNRPRICSEPYRNRRDSLFAARSPTTDPHWATKCHRGGKSTWPDRDSNSGPLAYRASTLTTELPSHTADLWHELTALIPQNRVLTNVHPILLIPVSLSIQFMYHVVYVSLSDLIHPDGKIQTHVD